MTFEYAFKMMPACLVGALDRPTTVEDLRFAAMHEIDCFESDEDGHLTAREIAKVRLFLKKIGGSV